VILLRDAAIELMAPLIARLPGDQVADGAELLKLDKLLLLHLYCTLLVGKPTFAD
jgi:hypothetical protein